LYFVVIGLPGLAFVTYINFFMTHQDAAAAIVLLVLGGPLLFIYTNGTGLQVAWDDARVYMRPQSFRPPSWRKPWLERLPWWSLGYDEIASMDDMTINDPAARSFLLPFQLLRLTAAGTTDEFDERHIWLYSLALRDKDLVPLLRQLDAKCPGMLPDIVRERLARWGDNDG
jgi:hypothetical protein